MKSSLLKIRTSGHPVESIWDVELTDLGAHQHFMGYSLTTKYLMVGITSPVNESQVSINSIPSEKEAEIIIPLGLEKCDCRLTGAIVFKGIDQLTDRWKIVFTDNRFGDEQELQSDESVPIRQPVKNTRHELLKLAGRNKNGKAPRSMFELRMYNKSV